MKARKLTTKQLERLIKALSRVYSGREIEGMEKIMQVMDSDRSGDIDETEWVQNLKKLPLLHAVLAADIDPDWGTLKSYRTFEDQLAKCMGNLERLRREVLIPGISAERKEAIEKEIRQRKDECKRFRGNGVVPSPAYVVFNQIDVGKTRKLTTRELQRLVKALHAVYNDKEIEPIDKIMNVMDSDRSGDIDENEWVQNLKKLPLLHEVLEQDIDPDWGCLRSYRTLEEQLAKLFGNISRLEAKIGTGEADTDANAELESRREQAAKLRAKGVIPTPGICVFSQLDVDKSRTLSKDELQAAVAKVKPDAHLEDWFKRLTPEGKVEFDENDWLNNLRKVPELLAALEADIDPDTGRLKSL